MGLGESSSVQGLGWDMKSHKGAYPAPLSWRENWREGSHGSLVGICDGLGHQLCPGWVLTPARL